MGCLGRTEQPAQTGARQERIRSPRTASSTAFRLYALHRLHSRAAGRLRSAWNQTESRSPSRPRSVRRCAGGEAPHGAAFRSPRSPRPGGARGGRAGGGRPRLGAAPPTAAAPGCGRCAGRRWRCCWRRRWARTRAGRIRSAWTSSRRSGRRGPSPSAGATAPSAAATRGATGRCSSASIASAHTWTGPRTPPAPGTCRTCSAR